MKINRTEFVGEFLFKYFIHRNNAKTFDPIWFKINCCEEMITFYQDIFDLNELFNFSNLIVFIHNIPIE